MKLKSFASAVVALTLSFGMAQPSLATEYTPPPEAFQGPGGWAVVDGNGNVYGVIVGDFNEATWNQVKNTRTVDGYMGCPAPCGLRFQTGASPDGNVAGYHGTQTHVDSDGNASQTNNGSVRYDAPSGNFEVRTDGIDGVTTVQTLVPTRQTATANRVTEVRTYKRIYLGEQSASVDTYRTSPEDQTTDVRVFLPNLTTSGTTLRYVFGTGTGTTERASQVQTDLISVLMNIGLTTTTTTVDRDTGEETSTVVLDQSNPIVQTVLSIGRDIVDFLRSVFGLEE